MEKGENIGILGENKWFLGKMNQPLEEQIGGMIICDKVCMEAEGWNT